MKPHRLLYAVALFSALAAAHAQTAQPMITPQQFFPNASGNPCSGCLLYTYSAGTTTPLATYTDASMTTQNTNPVVLDAAATAGVFLGANSYKFVLKSAAGTTIWTRDNVRNSFISSAGGTATGPIGGTSLCIASDCRTAWPSAGVTPLVKVSDFAGKSWSQLSALGQIVLNGYNNNSQLGGGTFTWITTPTTPDNCIYFAGNDDATGSHGVMARVMSGPLMPEHCGAVGDGTTDDTTALNNWAKVRWARTMRRTTYRVTGTINVNGDLGASCGFACIILWGIDAPEGAVIQQDTDNIPIMTIYGSRGKWNFPKLQYKNPQPSSNTYAMGMMIEPYPGVGGIYISNIADIRIDYPAVGLYVAPPISDTISGSASAGASSVTVTTAPTNALNAKPWMPQMWIQIRLDSGSWHITRIASVSGTTINLRDPLPTAISGGSGNLIVHSAAVQSGSSASLVQSFNFSNTFGLIHIFNPTLGGYIDRGAGTQNNYENIYIHGSNPTTNNSVDIPTTATNGLYLSGRSQDVFGIVNIEHLNILDSAIYYSSSDSAPVFGSIHYEGVRLKTDGKALFEGQSYGLKIGSVTVAYCTMLSSDGLTAVGIFKPEPTAKNPVATTSLLGTGLWHIGSLNTAKNIVNSTANSSATSFLVRDGSINTIRLVIDHWYPMRDSGFYPYGSLVTNANQSAPIIGNMMKPTTVAYGFGVNLRSASTRLSSPAGNYNIDKILVNNGSPWVFGAPTAGIYADSGFTSLLTSANNLAVTANTAKVATVLGLGATAQNSMLNNLVSSTWFKTNTASSAAVVVAATTVADSYCYGRNAGDNLTNLCVLDLTSNANAFTCSIATTTLTSSALSGIPISPGMVVSGTGITAGTRIVSGSGTTWTVDTSQTASGTACVGTLTFTLGQALTINGSVNPGLPNGTNTLIVDMPSATQIVTYVDSSTCTITPPAVTNTCGITSLAPAAIADTATTITVLPIADVFISGEQE